MSCPIKDGQEIKAAWMAEVGVQLTLVDSVSQRRSIPWLCYILCQLRRKIQSRKAEFLL